MMVGSRDGKSRLLTELPEEVLISVLCYLEPFWVSWLQHNTKDRELRQRITNLIPKLKLKHPSTTIRPFPGPSFIDYGRMTVRPILHQKIRQLQKSNKLTVKLNNAGFRLGQHVRIKYHNANSYWQRHYRPSELVGKRGYIVGCTPCYVHVAMGNVWSAYVNIIRKKNECVVLEYI
jgi:hypothetical protein